MGGAQDVGEAGEWGRVRCVLVGKQFGGRTLRNLEGYEGCEDDAVGEWRAWLRDGDRSGCKVLSVPNAKNFVAVSSSVFPSYSLPP